MATTATVYKIALKVRNDHKKLMEKELSVTEREDVLLNIAMAAPILADEVLKGNTIYANDPTIKHVELSPADEEKKLEAAV